MYTGTAGEGGGVQIDAEYVHVTGYGEHVWELNVFPVVDPRNVATPPFVSGSLTCLFPLTPVTVVISVKLRPPSATSVKIYVCMMVVVRRGGVNECVT